MTDFEGLSCVCIGAKGASVLALIWLKTCILMHIHVSYITLNSLVDVSNNFKFFFLTL